MVILEGAWSAHPQHAHRPSRAQQQLSYLCSPSLCLCTLRSEGYKTPEPPTGRAAQTAGRRTPGTGQPRRDARDASEGLTTWWWSYLQTPVAKPVGSTEMGFKQFSVIPGDVTENTLAAPRCVPLKGEHQWSDGREQKQCTSLWWRWRNVQRAPRLIPRSGSLGGGPVCPGWKQRRQGQHPRRRFFRRTKALRLFRQIYLIRLISVRCRTCSDPPRPGPQSAGLSGHTGSVFLRGNEAAQGPAERRCGA